MQPPRKRRPLRIVVIDDHDDGREMSTMTLEAGFDEHLVKPLVAPELERKLAALMTAGEPD